MSLASWTDLAVVWLSFLCFIGLIIPLVAGYYAVRGMSALNRHALPLMHKAQSYSRIARERTDDVSQRVAEPVLQARVRMAKWERVARALVRTPTDRPETPPHNERVG